MNDEGWQAWAATQPPRASRDLKRARAAVMVRLNCGPRDLRQVLKTFAQLEITVTVSLALSGCSSPRNILATRPWMDHCGGSSAWEIRTPSSSEADNTEFQSVSGIVAADVWTCGSSISGRVRCRAWDPDTGPAYSRGGSEMVLVCLLPESAALFACRFGTAAADRSSLQIVLVACRAAGVHASLQTPIVHACCAR